MYIFNNFFSKFFSILSFIFVLQFLTINSAMAVDTTLSSPSSAGATAAIEAKDALTCTLKRIVETLSGPIGRLIATLAIIALGIGLFMGKLSWGLAVATAMGIAMIFGATNIVDWLSGNAFPTNIYHCLPSSK